MDFTRQIVICLALLFVIVHLRMWSVTAVEIEPPRNLTCHICGPEIPPNYGCDQDQSKSPDGGEDRCHQCGIWEEWIRNPKTKKWEKEKKQRLCLISNVTYGCTYFYPAGAKGVVHEICRCTEDLCNANMDMTDIGGKGDPTKFPPPTRTDVRFAVAGASSTKVIPPPTTIITSRSWDSFRKLIFFLLKPSFIITVFLYV